MHKDFEATIKTSDWTSDSVALGTSVCKFTVGMMCSGFGAAAKADACNQGGSICAFYSGRSCTDDASCKEKP